MELEVLVVVAVRLAVRLVVVDGVIVTLRVADRLAVLVALVDMLAVAVFDAVTDEDGDLNEVAVRLFVELIDEIIDGDAVGVLVLHWDH